MSWRDILKEEIDWMKHYQKSLDEAKSKSKASLSPDDRGKVNFILREAEKALNRLQLFHNFLQFTFIILVLCILVQIIN